MEDTLQKLAQEERFEEAVSLRDRIQAVRFCGAHQSVLSAKKKDMDVIVFYQKKTLCYFKLYMFALEL